jgi:hypothetical protein
VVELVQGCALLWSDEAKPGKEKEGRSGREGVKGGTPIM